MSAGSISAEIPTVVEETGYAKVNLYLHVTGRRDDGYHFLDSLIAFTAAGDRISLAPRPAGAGPCLAVDGPFAAAVPTDGTNLALRAVHELSTLLDRPADVAVSLTKNLPVAAGIGGGSADAAAVIRGCLRLWGCGAGHGDAVHRLALGLGADVPVCLHPGSWFVGGIGEELNPGPATGGAAIVLVNPNLPVPTPAVFRARTGDFGRPVQFEPAVDQSLPTFLGACRNDLTVAAISVCPAIGDVLARLDSQHGAKLARMSGSGGTCFALFDDAAAADQAGQAISAAEPGWWVQSTTLL